MNTILTKSEVESLLPDYAFGKLSAEDMLSFEQAIILYPDLQIELSEIQSAFEQVKTIEFDSTIDHRMRNLSLRVNDRLGAERSKRINFNLFTRFVMPAIGIGVVVVCYVQFSNKDYQSPFQSTASNGNHLEIVRPDDAQLIVNEDVSYLAAIEESGKLITTPESIPEANASLDELLASSLQNWNEDTRSMYGHTDDLWLNFTETELQDIMKDLSYENPTIL